MRNENVKVGIKVVPFQKTALNSQIFSKCEEWQRAKDRNQKFLYVNSQYINEKNEIEYWLTHNETSYENCGNLYKACDFEPYIKEVKQPKIRDYTEQLKQLTKTTWDGDLICKPERDELVKNGLVDRYEGYNFLTKEGVETLVKIGVLRP